MRFLAQYPDGTLQTSNDSKEVQAAAEAFAAEHPGEIVHLYTHAMSIRSTPDVQE